MNIKQVLRVLSYEELFTKDRFAELVHEINPNYSERSVYWLLNKLQDENHVQKLGKNIFCAGQSERQVYTYPYSDRLREIIRLIEREYPLVDFQAWELLQLNEFVNHQIAHNVLFIEVENMLEEPVFHLLRERYACVLLCPSEDTFYRYKVQDDTIVIMKLISEAPAPIHGTHGACLEKILVDLFSRKVTGFLIERAEYPAVYEEAFSRYHIDERKMFRYARRRNIEKEITDFIFQHTNIKLITKET